MATERLLRSGSSVQTTTKTNPNQTPLSMSKVATQAKRTPLTPSHPQPHPHSHYNQRVRLWHNPPNPPGDPPDQLSPFARTMLKVGHRVCPSGSGSHRLVGISTYTHSRPQLGSHRTVFTRGSQSSIRLPKMFSLFFVRSPTWGPITPSAFSHSHFILYRLLPAQGRFTY